MKSILEAIRAPRERNFFLYLVELVNVPVVSNLAQQIWLGLSALLWAALILIVGPSHSLQSSVLVYLAMTGIALLFLTIRIKERHERIKRNKEAELALAAAEAERERRRQAKCVAAARRAVGLWAQQTLNSLKRQDWAEGVRTELLKGLESIQHEWEAAIETETARVIDRHFMLTALRSILPNNDWKLEYQDLAHSCFTQLIKPDELVNRTNLIMLSAQTKLDDVLKTASGEASLDQKVVSLLQRSGPLPIAQLSLPPNLGLSSDFVLGISAIGGGLALNIGSNFIGTQPTLKFLLKNVLLPYTPSQFAQAAVSPLVEFITDLVGEEFIQEVLEAFGVALTGIGLLFTGYKVVKYGWLGKRIFYDLEPLKNMQGSVQQVALDATRSEIDTLRRSCLSNFDAFIYNTEMRLQRLVHAAQ